MEKEEEDIEDGKDSDGNEYTNGDEDDQKLEQREQPGGRVWSFAFSH